MSQESPPQAPVAPAPPEWLSAPVAVALDAVLVLVFAVIGRASHEESDGSAILGAVGTAWPFLVGAALGWLLVRRGSGRWAIGVGPGITVWVSTLVAGMLLRALTGAGVSPSFVLVAGLVLGLFLLGWRAAVALVGARRPID